MSHLTWMTTLLNHSLMALLYSYNEHFLGTQYPCLQYTYWDLHTEKPQSEFSFANQCKPIKCCVLLFPHVRKAICPIRSCIPCFFTCEPYGKFKFSFKAGWQHIVLIRISSIINIESSCCGKSYEWKAFRYPRFFGRRVHRKCVVPENIHTPTTEGISRKYPLLPGISIFLDPKITPHPSRISWSFMHTPHTLWTK